MEGANGYVHTIGMFLFLYGLLKLFVAICLLFVIPKETQKDMSHIPLVNMFVTGDHSLAGKGLEIILGSFGLFSMMHGLALMGFFHGRVVSYFESKLFQYVVYSVFGVALIVFYSLVLYTNVPISKDENNRRLYWTYGYIGGASFLVVPVLWEIAIRTFPYLARLSLRGQLAVITSMFILSGIIAYVVMTNIPEDV